MSQTVMTGTRIRERRVLSGLRQSELARRAGISPSYLNLIEHNRRRIGGKTLLRLAEILRVEPVALSEGAGAALISALREAAGEQAMDHAADQSGDAPELDRIEEFAGRFPGWARLLADAHHRNDALERTIEALTDRLAHDPHLAASLHEVISAVTAIRSTASILVETEALEPEWQARFHRNIDEDSGRLTESAQALVRFLEGTPNQDAEIKAPQDEVQAYLEANGHHFAVLERESARPSDVERLLSAARHDLSAPALALTREVLLQYLRDSRALPLGPALRLVAAEGPDPTALARQAGTDLPTAFRRLATLPEAQAGPVGLVVCDASGTLIFRKPFPGFAMPRIAGACTLWPLYQVLSHPQVPLRLRLRQAGRRRETVQAMAAAEQAAPPGFGQPPLVRAHMLLLPDDGDAAAKPTPRPSARRRSMRSSYMG